MLRFVLAFTIAFSMSCAVAVTQPANFAEVTYRSEVGWLELAEGGIGEVDVGQDVGVAHNIILNDIEDVLRKFFGYGRAKLNIIVYENDRIDVELRLCSADYICKSRYFSYDDKRVTGYVFTAILLFVSVNEDVEDHPGTVYHDTDQVSARTWYKEFMAR